MPTKTRKHYKPKPPKKPEPQRRVLVFEGDNPAWRTCLGRDHMGRDCKAVFWSRGAGYRKCKACLKLSDGYGVRAVLHLD